jgi:hypothetical protein
VPPEVRAEHVEETKAAGEEISTDGLLKHAEQAAVQRLAANPEPPETYRYRLARGTHPGQRDLRALSG